MDSNFLVKMEYPFPANTTAQLCSMWDVALMQIKDEDFDTPEAWKDAVQNALNSQLEELESQKTDFIFMAESMRTALEQDKHIDTTEIICDLWKFMSVTSNLIRCYSAYGGVDGEMYGLSVLMDAVSGDDYNA